MKGVYCPSCGRKVEDAEHCSFCNIRLTSELPPFDSEGPIKEGVDSSIYLPVMDKMTVRPSVVVALVLAALGTFGAITLGGEKSERPKILLSEVGQRKPAGDLGLEIYTSLFPNTHAGSHSAWSLEQFSTGGEDFTEANFEERFSETVTREASFGDIQALFAEHYELYGPFDMIGFASEPSETESFAVVATRGPAYLGLYVLTEDEPPFKIKMLWMQSEE